MHNKQILQKDISQMLEEAIAYTTSRLLYSNLTKNGILTLEEAKFLNKLATEIITEAAEDFIPDEVIPDKTLTDEDGNVFEWNATTGELNTIDTPSEENHEEEEDPEASGMLPELSEPTVEPTPELGTELTESTIAIKLLNL